MRVRSDPPQDSRWFGARLNPPVPYLLVGPADLLVELWFHLPPRWTADQYSACDAQPHGDTLSFPGLSLSGGSEPRPVTVRLELWEGQHTLSCSRREVIHWTDSPADPSTGPPPPPRRPSHHELSRVVNVSLSCGHLGPGRRTLRLYDDSATDPHWYEVPLLFVSWYSEPEEGSSGDFWRVEDAAPLDELTPESPPATDTPPVRHDANEL
ncbi:uncharacterized protein LOC122368502 [Amphibalanus amphitrite]|uniref:uncharacterized protein LOC122368502 n=1 Tax=Amphibalanus amphitrite TaxID=1232801 RepID=UPI001C910EE3|nr:uncharacterized protein LOC122368502 [Amphibalanus amphitrite]